MNNSRRKIDAFDFKALCKIENLNDFGGFRIGRDGVYLNRLDEATLRLLSEEEKRAVQGWHPTGRYHEPALRFPCDVDEFLNFVNEAGLAGCIHGPTLSDWLQLTPPITDTREPDEAPPQVETAGNERPDTAISGATEITPDDDIGEGNDATTLSDKAQRQKPTEPWIEMAREHANTIWLRMLNLNKKPTKEGIAPEIAGQLRRAGTVTKRGRHIQPGYIVRFALRDGWSPPEPD